MVGRGGHNYQLALASSARAAHGPARLRWCPIGPKLPSPSNPTMLRRRPKSQSWRPSKHRSFIGMGDGHLPLRLSFECHTQSRSSAIASRDRPVATLRGLSATMASPLCGTASSSRSLISSQFSRRLPAALPPIRTSAQLPCSFSPCRI